MQFLIINKQSIQQHTGMAAAIYRQQKVLSHFPVCCWIDWLLMIKSYLIESGPPCIPTVLRDYLQEPKSRSGRHGEMKILDPTRSRTPTPRSSSPYLIAIPTPLSRL
jgi:hypothetical protein